MIEEDVQMQINIPNFIESLGIMGKGMLGIFMVTVILIISVYVLNFLGRKLENKKDDSES